MASDVEAPGAQSDAFTIAGEYRNMEAEGAEVAEHYERERRETALREITTFLTEAKFADESVENNARRLAEVNAAIGNHCVHGTETIFCLATINCFDCGLFQYIHDYPPEAPPS